LNHQQQQKDKNMCLVAFVLKQVSQQEASFRYVQTWKEDCLVHEWNQAQVIDLTGNNGNNKSNR